jgi:SAM-dependent methyltransferase
MIGNIVQAAMRLPKTLHKRVTIEELVEDYGFALNIGAKTSRYGGTCINLNIGALTKSFIDVRADAHALPFATQSFDTVVMSGVLQYCVDPRTVCAELARVLRPSGLLLVDAPFMQPVCPDTPDLWRFTEDGLRTIFSRRFDIERVEVSIAGGSAAAFWALRSAGNFENRWFRKATKLLVAYAVLPLVWWDRFSRTADVQGAGAFVMLARKKGMATLCPGAPHRQVEAV